MVVFIFLVEKNRFKDIESLQEYLIFNDCPPKCLEPDEMKEPTWRETTNWVHIRVKGSWRYIGTCRITKEPLDNKLVSFEHDELGRPRPVEHKHRYFDSTGKLLLVEETRMRAIIENKAEDLLPTDTMPHLSFGNGLSVTEISPRVSMVFAVFDHNKRKLADEVIEQIRL